MILYVIVTNYYIACRCHTSITVTVTVTVTLSHNHMSQWKIVEDSRRNNIITICLTHVNLKDKIWSLV